LDSTRPQSLGLRGIALQFLGDFRRVICLAVNRQAIYLDQVFYHNFDRIGKRLGCSKKTNVWHGERDLKGAGAGELVVPSAPWEESGSSVKEYVFSLSFGRPGVT
jgi:hypothetical protein